MPPASTSASRQLLPVIPLAALFFAAFVLPLAALVAISLFRTPQFAELSLVQYLRFFADPFSVKVLTDTLWLGAEVALATLILAYPLALVYVASGAFMRTSITFLIMLPLLTSTVVRTFAWIVILGRDGIVNSAMLSLGLWQAPARLLYTWEGMVLALTQIQLPLMALPVINSVLRLDGNLMRAAEGLGASRTRIFFTVILPLTLPGAIAGWLLVFAAAATAFITQTLVGGGRIILMPSYIYQQAVGVQDWPFSAALSLIFTLAVTGIVFAIGALSRRYVRGVDAA
ncbi:ABC transporter permease [Bradyrhizobium sp. INPA01-394B]|uniref:ABC transporter permease n=1 Tax=Bradyrhizobium campsiandrae TaxID=1729892 RepID=A0ABR7UBN7_9BRAD|nr:ABC transporter permease [Bradyrhizobium campsiandrae]MBC9877282.1 ABC transporter permease [Bradyrhizobium campsiandrae]MBC9981382.1 ABC transporter permease [Bradyrhizobium campsiandrae]